MTSNKKINMWSGPRNVSTAVMYSFAQRSDTKVKDEPFYAHYLIQSGAEHPGRIEVLENQPKQPDTVMKNLLLLSKKHPILFLKNMAHHMMVMDSALEVLISEFRQIFLIRDPKDMLISLDKTLDKKITLRDTAYKRQLELFQKVRERGLPTCVVDSKILLQYPETILSKLCECLDIPFDKSMLSWNAGPIPEDGVWAKYWYNNVHQSTGFKPYKPKKFSLPKHLKPLYKECKPIYEELFAHTIKIEHKNNL